MPVPRIAIIGRPNVGKSSLLNWLARRVSVVDPTAGVTRDRVTFVMQAGARVSSSGRHRGNRAARHRSAGGRNRTADPGRDRRSRVLMFVVDGQEGITPLDQEVAHD
ncbi:MAG: hypothetical protein CM1200mP2_08080 [Planctomycetaceae bacterium]|nr:MAG: hypothetical protein CM1200mP2_08080 [Planctomycetaceae bacterium]